MRLASSWLMTPGTVNSIVIPRAFEIINYEQFRPLDNYVSAKSAPHTISAHDSSYI